MGTELKSSTSWLLVRVILLSWTNKQQPVTYFLVLYEQPETVISERKKNTLPPTAHSRTQGTVALRYGDITDGHVPVQQSQFCVIHKL